MGTESHFDKLPFVWGTAGGECAEGELQSHHEDPEKQESERRAGVSGLVNWPGKVSLWVDCCYGLGDLGRHVPWQEGYGTLAGGSLVQAGVQASLPCPLAILAGGG